MSRYIKSAETLKARVGKQVKVDGEIFDVSYVDETIKFDNAVHSFNVVDDPVSIGRFLRAHNVASAGYKFKHASSSKFILNKECRVTLKPYVGNFDDHSSCHTVVGMIRLCKDHVGDRGYMLLTNDEHLRGDPADDMKGYDWSWWLGHNKEDMEADVERTEPLEKPSEEFTNDLSKLPLNKPVKVQFKMYPGETYEGMFKRCHKDEDSNERIFFLSNHKTFDGCVCLKSEREGYKYSWSMSSVERSNTTTYEYKIVGDSKAPKKIPLEKLEEKEYSLCKLMGEEDTRRTVKGVIKELKGISYLLSNDDTFDGGHPDATEGTDYKYGWWLCKGSDISKSIYAIREACAESAQTSSKTVKEDPLVRIAMALEDIATYLSRMSK